MQVISQQEALDFKLRWKVVNDFIAQGVRGTSPRAKLRQIQVLFNSRLFFSGRPLSKDIEQVRNRWIRLKDGTNG